MYIKHIKRSRKAGKMSKLKENTKCFDKELRRSKLTQTKEKKGYTDYVILVTTTREGQIRTRHELNSLPEVLNNLNNV